MRRPAAKSVLGTVLLGLAGAACAGIVGADFGDVHAALDAGPVTLDAPAVIVPENPEGSPDEVADTGTDSTVAADEAGDCPAGLSACVVGGAKACVDLTTNPSHCHACDTSCPSDPNGIGTPVCTVASGCTYTCPMNYILCAGGVGCCPLPVAEAGAETGTPATTEIPCAATLCPTNNGGFCCGDSTGSRSDVCGNAANAIQLGCRYEFFCSSFAQCGTGTVCCFNDSQSPTSACQTACSHGETQFCDPTATGECPTGTTCSASNTYTGDNGELQTTFHFCQ